MAVYVLLMLYKIYSAPGVIGNIVNVIVGTNGVGRILLNPSSDLGITFNSKLPEKSMKYSKVKSVI